VVTISLRSIDGVGILVSNETAVSMVQNLGTSSKFLIPVIVRVLSRDPFFVEQLLWSDPPEIQIEQTDTAPWNVATWVQQLYEQHPQAT